MKAIELIVYKSAKYELDAHIVAEAEKRGYTMIDLRTSVNSKPFRLIENKNNGKKICYVIENTKENGSD